MSYYTTTQGSLIPRLLRTLRSKESRYAPRHDTLGGLSKQAWGEVAENFKVMDMTYEISNRNAMFEKSQARMEALFTRMKASCQSYMQKLAFVVADAAKVERETYQKLSIGLENRHKALPENFLYYEEDGEASLQFQGDFLLEELARSVVSNTMFSEDNQDWKSSEGTHEAVESSDLEDGLIGGSTEQDCNQVH